MLSHVVAFLHNRFCMYRACTFMFLTDFTVFFFAFLSKIVHTYMSMHLVYRRAVLVNDPDNACVSMFVKSPCVSETSFLTDTYCACPD